MASHPAVMIKGQKKIIQVFGRLTLGAAHS